jgi:hypothetical protein
MHSTSLPPTYVCFSSQTTHLQAPHITLQGWHRAAPWEWPHAVAEPLNHLIEKPWGQKGSKKTIWYHPKIIQKSSKNHPKSSKIYIVTFASTKGFPGCFFLHHYIFRILFEHNQGRHLIISRSRRAVDLLERVAASATILLSLSGLILIKIQMFIPNINGTEESHLLFSWVPAATSMKVFGAHKSSNWNAVLALTRKNANRTNI